MMRILCLGFVSAISDSGCVGSHHLNSTHLSHFVVSALYKHVLHTAALCAEQEQSEAELAEAARQLTEAIMRNASVALDQAEHQRETARLSTRYQELQDKNEALKQEIREKISRRRRVDSFIRELKNLPQHAEQFDAVAFRILVERITVYEGKRVVVRFNDGTEIEA